jgi:hypothetical protein
MPGLWQMGVRNRLGEVFQRAALEGGKKSEKISVFSPTSQD